MPKQPYTPTESDRLTGARVRQLRKLAGETLAETIAGSGIDLKQSSLSRVELGQRHLSNPEATKLAAHFNTTVDKIRVKPQMTLETAISAFNALRAEDEPESEQAWLGNEPAVPTPLFPVHDAARSGDVVGPTPRTMLIDLDAPLSPAQYREQVWIPYLEQRYAADLKATG